MKVNDGKIPDNRGTIQIEPELHKRIKIEAAKQSVSMKEWLTAAIAGKFDADKVKAK